MGATGAPHDLWERDAPLASLVRAVTACQAGSGSLVMVEAAAGLGKTRLLNEAVTAAAEPTLVLRAAGEELERMRPWALVRSLFGDALGDRLATGSDDPLALIHSLFWLTADLATDRPLLLVIDDAHWADPSSLRFVRYLLARLGDLPVGVLIAGRPRESGSERADLDAIASDDRVEVVELRPLSEPAVGALLRSRLSADVESDMITACAEVTGGNPFYLSELARELRAGLDAGDLPSPSTVRQISLASVARTVFLRLSRLGADAQQLARAVAILGDRAAFPHAAELAGLAPERASTALDALAAAEILQDREPLGFVHPLVARAIYGDLPAGARGDLHARAAKVLGRDGATQEEVASQLLLAGRRADPWAVEALVAAAARAMSEGAVAAAAAQYLERALEEPPPPSRRAEVLTALGRAEALLGRPQAVQRFREALGLAQSVPERAQLALDLGRALGAAGEHRSAASTFRGGLDELTDPSSELYRELHTAWVMSAALSPEAADSLPRSEPAVDPTLSPTPGQRQLLTLTALRRAFEGAPSDELVALAERAWDQGGALKGDAGAGMSWSLLTTVYCVADDLERELELCGAMLADAQRRGSPMAFATVSYCRAFPLLHQGRIDDAVADVQAALGAREDGWSLFVGSAAGCLALGQIERGALEEARASLAPVQDDPAIQGSLEYLMILGAQGCLALAENRPQDALAPLLRAEEISTSAGIRASVAFPWASVAAIAASLAGDRELGARLADEALSAAQAQGAPRAIAHARRACGYASQGDEAIGHFQAAVQACDGQQRLQQMHALVDLGAALRRCHRRAEAREPLRRGLAMASAGGAHALADRARTELAAAGAHVPAHSRSGLESLTPSERRVAELAAAGHSNRAIAQSLFVTVKAVEYHLANTYRKLEISGRRELAPLLEQARSAR